MPQIDAERFLRDLNDLRQIGAYRTGVHRPTYSPQDMESRRWLMQRMAEIGLEPSIDGIGNVYGRHAGAGPHLLAGSHIETQNYAGWLDGALGVVAGLALARAGLPVDVVAFADEEGHFEGGFLGSRSIIGNLTEEEIDRSRNRTDGTPLREALAAAGLAGKPRMQLEPGRHKGFFEMHIEQGTQLEGAGLRAGVVTGIVAIWQWRILIEGMQDHAGGTTMAERRDAGLAAVRLLTMIDQEMPKACGGRSTWTTGRIALDPGAPSIIPGQADILFQFRDIDVAVLERMERCLRACVQESNRRERTRATLINVSKSLPAPCDPAMMAALDAAAEAIAPGGWQRMPSGAGHDAQYIARVMPVAMLFTPSIGGISHHWAEDTKEEDLALCMRILGDAAERFLRA
ncbi:Zn-dependent hydrolase [Paracraurococcus lichenis]|uniref:Zn-dependent hydrolase n=1 Tax=Paracraurococcus lichenis TaxID=3064888 RepID=A0ABT9E7C6_9PROT|nr:Zn-dependent hydrolase [Paracraurococcus sp. LOR1-02]MDO9712068.1 Zn-dependent hydrolase [Paracraurococcus sp. LOR1-02]